MNPKLCTVTLALVGLLAGCGLAPDTAPQTRARADFRACLEQSGTEVVLTHVGPRGGLKWAADGGDPDGVRALRGCLRSRGYRVHGHSAGPSRGLQATIKAETR